MRCGAIFSRLGRKTGKRGSFVLAAQFWLALGIGRLKICRKGWGIGGRRYGSRTDYGLGFICDPPDFGMSLRGTGKHVCWTGYWHRLQAGWWASTLNLGGDTAKAGKPLGLTVPAKPPVFNEYDWRGRYWESFGDAR